FEFTLSALDRTGALQEKRYTVLVNRVLSGDASLQQLAFAPELLAELFTGQLSLHGVVAYEQDQVKLIALPREEGATLQVVSNGQTIESDVDGTYVLPLHVGGNTVQVTVTAENGVDNRTYTVRIERLASRNATLSALEAEPLTL